jgi:hypothetical protein
VKFFLYSIILRLRKNFVKQNIFLFMGRPPTKPARLKDGFYIELKNSGSSGVRIRRDTKEQMLLAAEEYSKNKNVVILGEMRNDKWVTE